MLVTEVQGRWARISCYDREINTMVDVGWVEVKEWAGWTVDKFDWEGLLEKRRTAKEDTK
jgi:hypothetical protein